MVEPGDDLASFIHAALREQNVQLEDGDVIAVAQKVVSKAEGRYIRLADIDPDPEALSLAAEVEKDARLVQLILRESTAVVRKRTGVLIVRHRLGYVHANAGIDHSNMNQTPGGEQVLLLPENPDASARHLRDELARYCNVSLHVLINDTTGRAWRYGTAGMAIGTAGFSVIRDQVGERDLYGNSLEATITAVADELAAAASFVMGQAAEGTPVVLIRGARLERSEHGSQALIRPLEQDLFR